MDTKHLDIITTSLEALLQRGTSPKNVSRDSAAIDAFCGLVNKEPNCIPTAAKLIVSKMQSMQEWEALQALQLLEACMQNCGPQFHAEVGKFRFLNELIKLISPKYLGSLTPDAVRTEIIELLYLWTREYPIETKIREAYEMLKKQRVVQADPSISNRRLPPSSSKPVPPPPSQSSSSRPHTSSSILEDVNQAKLLQKLLQSKKPEDLQAANKLIRSMVSEEEKKMEERCKVMLEMDSIKNNVSLLNEMLDNYSGTTSDWELIRELYTTCEGFQSSLVTRVQHLPTGDDDLLQLVISSNESLTSVLAKYDATLTALKAEETSTPLLDVNSARPSPQHSLPNASSHMNDLVDLIPQASTQPSSHPSLPSSVNNMDLLNDLMNTSTPDSALLSFTTNQESSNTTVSALLNLSANQNTSSGGSTHPRDLNSINGNLNSSQHSALSSLMNAALENPPMSNQTRLSEGNFPSSKEDGISKCPAHFLSSIPDSKSLNSLLESSLLNGAQTTPSFQPAPVIVSHCLNSSQPSLSQQMQDLISKSPTNLKSPQGDHLRSALGLTNQASPVVSSTNGVHQQTSVSQLQKSISGGQSPSTQNQSLISQSSNALCGSSPKTVNKLKALRDLDEMVGRSLTRLGLNDEGGRKDGDGSETVGMSHEGGNFSLEGKLESPPVTNGCTGKENGRGDQPVLDSGDVRSHLKLEGSHPNSERSRLEMDKGDCTMLQEDDEQLLLDDFTLGEAPVSGKSGKEQDGTETKTTSNLCDTKLSDIQISLSDIQPSGVESLCALDNVNNLKILVHLTRTRPKPNVAVFVVTTMSSHSSPVCGYLFQPVIPKGYKLKLQPPSATSLPAFNPFLPSPAITQIMLIASPLSSIGNSIGLKFVVSYEIEGENVSEMGEIAELPLREV